MGCSLGMGLFQHTGGLNGQPKLRTMVLVTLQWDPRLYSPKLPMGFPSWQVPGGLRKAQGAQVKCFLAYMHVCVCVCVRACVCVRLVAQSCPTLCDPMGGSLPGSSVHGDSPGKSTGMGCHALPQGILPTRGLNPVSHIAGRFFTIWATREAHPHIHVYIMLVHRVKLKWKINFVINYVKVI